MEAPFEEPKHLRTLRRLVNTLTIVLILGFITVVVVIVIRFGAPATVSAVSTGPELPAHIDLPGSETPQAVTFGSNWTALVTIDEEGNERIRIYKLDGMPAQTIDIEHYE